MPEALKEELRVLFAKLSRPANIVEPHCFVSSDLTHDNAFVQHVNDKYITPYAQSIGKFTTCYVRSDGCKSQFKCAQHFSWISQQSTRNSVRIHGVVLLLQLPRQGRVRRR
eukprot:3009294-Pleurochrysis_carterae.AAC.1